MSAFFNKGQTLETFRGRGIFQPAIDTAIAKLGETRWVHLFPEGAVNLTQSTRMRRFKWGVARLILEAPKTPVVVPLWLTGFDQVMPEHRRAPRFLPRLGAEITVSFGEPIAPALLQPYVDLYTQRERMSVDDVAHALPALSSRTSSEDLYPTRPATLRPEDSPTYAALRSHLAAFLREELARVGDDATHRFGLGPSEKQLAHRADLIGSDYKTDVPT